MKKILRYLWFVLCTVIYSSAYANTCSDDPEVCSEKQLCELASFQHFQGIHWHVDYRNGYVKEAKRRGLQCNVNTGKLNFCTNDPELCTQSSTLCNYATITINGKTIWKMSSSSYAAEAKSRGLTCGVEDQTAGDSKLPECSEAGVFKNNCFGTDTFDAGHKYVGDFKDNTWHGQGTFTFANGNKYVGDFKDNTWHGQGTLTFADGNKYVGDFKDNIYQGQGTFTYSNGTKYVGEFQNGEYNGQGTHTLANGDEYVGAFKDNKWHGQGAITYANGDKYVGIFKDDKQDGKGTLTFASGNQYVGEFKDDKFSGWGTYTFANGQKYSGFWKNDKKHGKGTLTTFEGNQTRQTWAQGVLQNTCSDDPKSCITKTELCEKATYYSINGANWGPLPKRAGHVKEAKRRGLTCGVKKACADEVKLCSQSKVCTLATFTKNGLRYWSAQSGYTRYVSEAKRRGLTCGVGNTGRLPDCPSSGIRNNCFGTYDWEDGAKYVGEWKNGKRHGQGSYIHSSGDISIGEWIDSERKGETVYIWKTGQALFEPNWKPDEDYTSDSTVQKMFPYLVRQFNSFSKDNRKELQRSLQRKGLYSSTVDGQWGRNTLIGFTRFSSEYMRTVNLKDNSTVDEVVLVDLIIDAIYKQGNLSKVQPASKSLIDSMAAKKNKAAKVLANVYQLENSFKELASTSRKQVQWSLRERGYYKSSIDGLWGKGTQSAVVQYTQDSGLDARYPDIIYFEVKEGMNPPTSFTVARKPSQSNQNSSGNALGKLLLLGVACGLLPDPTACAAGAASAISGTKSPDYSSGNSSSSSNYSSGSSSSSSNSRKCSRDSDCAYRQKCVKRSTYSMCVIIEDERGRAVRDSRDETPVGCRRNSDCPRKFECNRNLRICVKEDFWK